MVAKTVFYICYKIFPLIKINLKIEIQHHDSFLNHLLKTCIKCNGISSNNCQWVKHETITVFRSACIEMKLDFWHLLLELMINLGVLIRCKRVEKNLKINKRLSSCIEQPRVYPIVQMWNCILCSPKNLSEKIYNYTSI